MVKKRHLMEMKFETKASEPAVLLVTVISKSYRKERAPDNSRNGNWWPKLGIAASFKKRLRVSGDTFEYILSVLPLAFL